MEFLCRKFQSTLPRGERPITAWKPWIRPENFNPRSREGSDKLAAKYHNYFGLFQSTLPRGERHLDGAVAGLWYLFQSTLPRGERRPVHLLCDLSDCISIHAPARGATESLVLALRFHIISIHAPARGATSILSKIHPMFLTISHNASSFSSFPFHSFLPHLLNSSTFCALFQVRISRAFSVYYRFAPKKSTPDL